MKIKSNILTFTRNITALCAVFLTVFACELPTSVQISGSPGISLPFDISGDDLLGGKIFEDIQAAAAGMDMKVMRYPGYNAGKDQVQTFLFQYMMKIEDDLNNFLNDINLDTLKDAELFDSNDISLNEIKMNNVSNINLGEIAVLADLSEAVEDIIDSIKDAVNPANKPPEAPLINAPGHPSYVQFETISISGLDTVSFKDGQFSVQLTIKQGNNPVLEAASLTASSIAGVTVVISSITISDGVNNINGHTSLGGSTFNLSGAAPSVNAYFDLADHTLKKDFWIYIASYTTNGITSPGFINIEASPDVSDDPTIRAVTGFDLQTVLTMTADTLNLDLAGGDFYHGEIDTGIINFQFPEPNGSSATWLSGINAYASNFVISQALYLDAGNKYSNFTEYPSGWPGLSINGMKFNENVSLNAKNINPQIVNYTDADIQISAVNNKASFWLHDDDIDNPGNVSIIITPVIKLQKFSKLHINAGNLNEPINIQPFKLGDSGKYIKQINFNYIGFDISFDEANINGLTMELHMFDADDHSKVIITDPKNVSAGLVSITKGGAVLEINNRENFSLEFELILKHDGKAIGDVIRINNHTVNSESNSLLKVADDGINPVFDWSSALIDLSAMDDVPLSGSFPDGEGLNLNDMLGSFASGFIFENIEAYLYIGLSEQLTGAGPGIMISMKGGGVNYDVIDQKYLDDNGCVIIPSIDYIFTDLDPANTGIFNESDYDFEEYGIPLKLSSVLNEMPEGLIFNYDVILDAIAVTPDDLENLGSGGGEAATLVEVAFIMIMPMTLKASDDGAVIKIPEIFSASEDFLWRENNGGIFNMNISDDMTLKINSLSLKITLSDVFTGGEIYMRRTGEEEGKERLKFSINKSVMDFNINKNIINYLNSEEGYPYLIEEVGIRFKKGDTIKIPPNLKVNIDFSADFRASFPLELDL